MRKKVFSLILSAILVMALIGGIGLSARATAADEAAYADVFEQVRNGICDGNYFEAYSPEISDIPRPQETETYCLSSLASRLC